MYCSAAGRKQATMAYRQYTYILVGAAPHLQQVLHVDHVLLDDTVVGAWGCVLSNDYELL